MTDYSKANEQDLRRQRRERYIIAILIVIILFLTNIGVRVFDLGLDLPISNSILIFVLININIILLLLLLFLTMRNLVKLLFERKKRIMGARLRTKLVLAFITLSLIPTIILFFVSVQFISTSIEYWFNLPIEKSLKNSVEVGQDYYNQVSEEILSSANNLSRLITYHGYMLIKSKDKLEKFINEKRIEYHLASVKVFSQKMEMRTESLEKSIDLSPFKGPQMDLLEKSFNEGTDNLEIQSSRHGNLISGIVPIFSRTESKAVVGLIVLEKFIPGFFVTKLETLSSGLDEYLQFKMLKKPIKLSNMITLSIVTLLIIFSSIWFGFFLSKGITVPIQELAEGTNRIASGNYDFSIDLEATDEIGDLVNSFNRMTLDLRTSKKQLEQANEELVKSNIEIEQRRLYMETVLANVAAGVMSVDAEGKILTINKSAEKMLGLKSEEVIRKNYKEVMAPELLKVIREFLIDRGLLRKGSLERQIRLTLEGRTLPLLVSINILHDDRGDFVGLVTVFEDVSEIEKVQRMAAWREVARRIAHEVKNPLTPIQLSAQRLKKKYGDEIGARDGKVFEECTDMIINQAEGLKRLVNEFSSYARMPASNPVPDDINGLIKEATNLYQGTNDDISVIFHEANDIPLINIDKEQIKRVMINLLDNAIAAIDGNGEIVIDLEYDKELKIVRIGVTDNGKGIPSDHKMRLFEPYFSTKKHGTGLGLAIVNTIISDHNGSIEVLDNKPQGTRFIIELPAVVS